MATIDGKDLLAQSSDAHDMRNRMRSAAESGNGWLNTSGLSDADSAHVRSEWGRIKDDVDFEASQRRRTSEEDDGPGFMAFAGARMASRAAPGLSSLFAPVAGVAGVAVAGFLMLWPGFIFAIVMSMIGSITLLFQSSRSALIALLLAICAAGMFGDTLTGQAWWRDYVGVLFRMVEIDGPVSLQRWWEAFVLFFMGFNVVPSLTRLVLSPLVIAVDAATHALSRFWALLAGVAELALSLAWLGAAPLAAVSIMRFDISYASLDKGMSMLVNAVTSGWIGPIGLIFVSILGVVGFLVSLVDTRAVNLVVFGLNPFSRGLPETAASTK